MDNYEEKYKKALSWMQGLYKGLHGKTKEEAEEAFPELKEIPKDETIKKALLRWFENCEHVYFAGVDTSDIIAWLKEQIELSVGIDLQSEIDNLSKRYPEVSFAKLSRIAVHIANWQKQQIAKDNMLLPFKEYDNLMDSINRRKKEGYEAGCKQGLVDSKDGHKPTEKSEPKFKVGDWIVKENYSVQQVKIIKDDSYILDEGIEGVETLLQKYVEENYHLWTIQDAKDGDVLACESGWTCIFRALDNHTNTFSSYCFMDSDKWFCNTGCTCHTLDEQFIRAYNFKLHPATKEQRDLLFQKMEETGYVWDDKKLERKKVQQRPTEWTAEDEEELKIALNTLEEAGQYSSAKWLKNVCLVPRNRWKPTELQLGCLSDAIEHYNKLGYDAPKLKELLEQLKKLRED